jgi:hypothetical protein
MIVQIEDELHAELHGQFTTIHDAIAELRLRAHVPWDQTPNRAPSISWKTCGRAYAVIEYDNDCSPWKELRRLAVLEVSASGVKWSHGFEDGVPPSVAPQS